jgi:hypothetical protein
MYLIVVVCGSVRTNLFISFLPVDRDVPDKGGLLRERPYQPFSFFLNLWIGMYLIRVVCCGSVRTNIFLSFTCGLGCTVPDTGATSGVPSFSFLF